MNLLPKETQMTNDQKLLELITKTDALLKALDKVDATNGSSIFKDEARKQRRELKIWLACNRVVTVAKQQAVNKKPAAFNYRNNWLGR